jgi:hypothetical protein
VDNSVGCGQLRQEATFSEDVEEDPEEAAEEDVVDVDFSDEELDFSDEPEELDVVDEEVADDLLSERLSVR